MIVFVFRAGWTREPGSLILGIKENGVILAMCALEPLGDRAFLARFATEREAARWASAVRARNLPGVTDVVVAYRSAAVLADPEQADLDDLVCELRLLPVSPDDQAEGKLLGIPVLYDGADLEDAAGRLGLRLADVIALHTASPFEVFAIGFLQGFPYAGYLPTQLSGLPRREEPRLSVPAGSVAIAGRQTGVYPRSSPGGWHLLGRTPLLIADANTGYFPIHAGDRIQFRSIDIEEFEALRDQRL
ncbi:MAG: carboxyltransferase domain-containing protein [Planctomycetaceae bacterium]|nr:carboxyltransferase domain-containing protein [Planctomycetaceae bacterium]